MKRVALLVDAEQRVDGDPELLSRQALRHAPMEYHLAKTLRALGYGVAVIRAVSGKQLITDLGAASPDVVFNATEKIHDRRADDMLIPALLELLHLPYTGATAACLMLNRDKAVSKSIASMAGVRVPEFHVMPRGRAAASPRLSAFRAMAREDVGSPDSCPLPAIVKPISRDSSEGITLRGIARTPAALIRAVRVVHDRYREPAIVESLIDGVDLYATVVQGRTLHMLPPIEMLSNGSTVATYHVKHNDAYRKRWGIRWRVAKLAPRTVRALRTAITALWPALQLRDYARIDFRLTPSGELYFIEANPNPGFWPGSRCSSFATMEYGRAVGMIVRNALARSPV